MKARLAKKILKNSKKGYVLRPKFGLNLVSYELIDSGKLSYTYNQRKAAIIRNFDKIKIIRRKAQYDFEWKKEARRAHTSEQEAQGVLQS